MQKRMIRSGLVVALLAGISVATPGPEVRFVAPRHLSTAIGPTIIELELDTPVGLRIQSIELTVDGQLLAVLVEPPWRTTWDAGDGSRGHRLEATAIWSGDRRAHAAVRTSPLHINQFEEVDLVNLYPVVRDRAGNYVTDLTREDFQIVESGAPQKIERFTAEQRQLRVGIVLDTSLSMAKGNKLDQAQKAALGFLKALRERDEGMVVTFNDAVQVAQEFTSNTETLGDAIMTADAQGGTALYDAIWRTSKKFETFDGRRVLVLLSDGRDEATSGFEPGSLHTLQEALDRALRSEVMLFSIGLGRNLEHECARPWVRRVYDGGDCPPGESLQEILGQLAEATGGRLLLSPSAGRLRRAFEAVAEDLRHQYSIAYKSTNPLHDGTWREIRVVTPGRDFEVVSRKGYFAPEADDVGRSGTR